MEKKQCSLFSDVVMPNSLDGYELAEQAMAIKQDSHKRYSNNMLNKPYRQTELLKKIRSTLDET